MRIALYARVSKRDSKQDTENQLAQLREFAQAQNWTIVHEYVDRATGKHSDREQFQRLFEDASKRKFDLVLFWSLDRWRAGNPQPPAAPERQRRGFPILHGAVPGLLRDLQRL